MLAQKVAALESALKDKELRNTELLTKIKELSANFTIEQESSQKLRQERDLLEAEVKGLKEDINILRQSSSQSSDAVSQKLKELEIEKRTLKSRLDQVEQDLYKAQREKVV